MRFLAATCLLAVALTGCAKALPTARPAATTTARAQASTVEMRRAVKQHAMLAFAWADASGDGILVMAEAEALGLGREAFLRRDKDANGALSFPELLGATHLTDEVQRIRELAGQLAAGASLDRAAWLAAPVAVRPTAYTPSPAPGIKAALFAPADANGDGKLDQRELETAIATGIERGYEVVAAAP